MSTRARTFEAQVLRRERLSPHLLRLVLGGPGLAAEGGLVSTGVADEWLGLVVPGQFQSRYYTVRRLVPTADGCELTLDVVVHDVGLVTEWAQRGLPGDDAVIGETVVVTEPKGSFAPPADAAWLVLVGDLTALPAMARIVEEHGARLPVQVWAEVPEIPEGYLPEPREGLEITWLPQPGDGASRLAEVVEALTLPEGPGYFWMAGESAQMRAVRKHLMRTLRLPAEAFDVMGYWRGTAGRQPRAVDPAPIWRAGKAAGKSDEEIWADYDRAREEAEAP
ncbi:siderophore-interacting protein [Nocardioides sp. TRM66260-LWL]|uniref:siderophore-interacting protein n=1 Tax=Nocardioides sp. TRM66260-LWL TaxID=2874478 RepID=UPI001CC5392E|nr:siderophore-interacting protein [Nocardioides sp. TRM66260-LWL]MBZ5733405.1 siderophore-interacting protein [Nocardioides sp. TRM66260-LWL]